MNCCRVLILLLALMMTILPVDESTASKTGMNGTDASLLSLRAGRHPHFYRIVLEGAEEVVSKGHVKQAENDIQISFDNASIDIENEYTPFTYKTDGDSVVVSLPMKGDMKVFSLTKPSRLVVDVYPATHEKNVGLSQGNQLTGKAKPRHREKAVPANGQIQSSAVQTERTPADDMSVVMARVDSDEESGKTAALEPRTPQDDRAVVLRDAKGSAVNNEHQAKKRTPEDDRSMPLVERKMKQIAANDSKGTAADPVRTEYEESMHQHQGLHAIIVPEKFEELWVLLQAGNAIGNLAKLSHIEPEGTEEIAFYYYLSGEGLNAGGQYLKAIDHLRLAYIYSTDSALKDLALFRRAKVYEMMGLYHEARSNYLVFISEFPVSKNIEKAYFGLANCSQKQGLLQEAVQYYDRAGDDAVTLFHKANALQKLERVEDARKIYEIANRADSSYPKRSFETYYLLGENMRLGGELKKAKEHFSNIQYGPFLDSAKISLGLIAMDEANIKEAGRNFLLASESKNRDIRVRALFSLAFALLSIGQTQEAIEALEEIRFNHLDSDLYKDSLLALARLYHKEGKIREAVSVIKELAYGKQPPAETFNELESIVLGLSEKETNQDSDEMTFLEVWSEVDGWLMEESREEFLLRMARRLRYEGQPFIKLSGWLIENGSVKARVNAAVGLADYFIGIGKIGLAEAYMTRAIDIEKPGDAALRVKAKILRAKQEYISAVRTMALVKEFGSEDLTLTAGLLLDMDRAKSAEKDEAIAFYEKKLNSGEWEAHHYVRLADILYNDDLRTRAIAYYRTAHSLSPDDEWISYRIGRHDNGGESQKLFAQLEKGGSLVGRLAKSKLLEINLLNRIREVY